MIAVGIASAHEVIRPAICQKLHEHAPPSKHRAIAFIQSAGLEQRISRLEDDVNELKVFDAQIKHAALEAKAELDASKDIRNVLIIIGLAAVLCHKTMTR